MSVWNPTVQRTFAAEQAALNGNVAAISQGFATVIHAGLGVGGAVHRDAHVAAGIGGSFRLCLPPTMAHVDYLIRAVYPTEIAAPGEAIAAYLADTMSADESARCAQLHGVVPDHFLATRLASRRKPETIESGILRNRQAVNDAQHGQLLRQLGFTDPTERGLIAGLRYDVPGPSDLVRFAVRHAFEPEILAALGYHAEYRPALDYYHQTAGLNYPIFTGPLKQTIIATSREFPEIFEAVKDYAREQKVAPPASPEQVPEWFAERYRSLKLPEPTWAVMYWWSHWVLPSPTQGALMLGRLRPDRDKTGEPAWMAAQSFSIDDYRLLLRANDYPPFWRDKMATLVYALPGIRYVRLLVAQKVWNEDDVFHLFQKTPYKDSDARSLARAIVGDVQQKEREKIFRSIKRELDSAWELGLITDQQYLNNYEAAGIPAAEAEVELNAAIVGRNVRLGKELLAVIRKAYLRGSWNKGQAVVFMSQINIVPRRQGEYLRTWDAERQAGRRDLSASQLKKAVIEGLVDLATYVQRLRNLDYADSAIEVMLAEARIAIAEKETKALHKIAAEQAHSEKARLAALAALERQRKALAKALAGKASASKLKTWYCDGLITAREVTERLLTLGWNQHDIDMLLGECDAKRQKAGHPTYSEESGQPQPPT